MGMEEDELDDELEDELDASTVEEEEEEEDDELLFAPFLSRLSRTFLSRTIFRQCRSNSNPACRSVTRLKAPVAHKGL